VDIWTPPTERAEKLPVYVYYHGGANTASSGRFRLENVEHKGRYRRIPRPNPILQSAKIELRHQGCPSPEQGKLLASIDTREIEFLACLPSLEPHDFVANIRHGLILAGVFHGVKARLLAQRHITQNLAGLAIQLD
jgi:hypothetical protein